MPDHEREACEHGHVPTRAAVPTNEGIMTMAMDGLYKECYLFWPDVIFFVSAFYMTAPMLQVLRTRRHKIVMLHTESPYQDDEQMSRGQFADLNLLNDPANLDLWNELDIPAVYMPHAYDPDVHYPNWGERKIDFSFVGTLFRSRAEFFSQMDFAGVDVAFGGGGWDTALHDNPDLVTPLLKYLGHPVDHCVDNAETARIYRDTKVGINFYRRESEESQRGKGWAMGPREVELAACGTFFLRDPRPESDELFGHILPSFSSPQEASDLLHDWLKWDQRRTYAAERAYDAVKDRTFDNHAAKLMRLMEEAGIL